ncbi:MAG: retropepsin-like aspartic protease [Acidobacteriota bacterium]
MKSYEYRKAAEVYKTLLALSREKGDVKKAFDYGNLLRISSALGDAPRQSVSFNGDSRIALSRSLVGMQLPVEINNQKVSFIFDTGANISTITASFAAKLGLKIIDVLIAVGSITGNKVKSRLALATAMRIGNSVVRNAVFLVFDDKDLFIPQANFQIDAILGFPVIEALKEITISRGGEIFIPARAGRGAEQNMCLAGLTPLIAGIHKGRRLTFTFDTGARTSSLYPPFFKAYEEEIKARGVLQPEKITGAGGSKEVQAYRVSDIAMTFAGKEATFASVKVLIEETLDNSRYFYGNLGQDLIRQFEKITLNFRSMSMVFE